MATAAWSRLRAPPLHSGATDTLFGLPVHGCHVPDLWLTVGASPFFRLPKLGISNLKPPFGGGGICGGWRAQ